jgi:hypothetical protein
MSWECQGRQQHGWFGSGTCDDAIEQAANGAVAALPPADRPRYERWLRGGGLAALKRAAPALFAADGAAPMPSDGPTAAALAEAVRRVGLDRWPRAVAEAEQAASDTVAELPPGRYFAPLVPLMNRILAARTAQDAAALRPSIKGAFYDVGDSIGGNQVNATLSDLIGPGVRDADRREIADELAHYARADPAVMGELRARIAGLALAVGSMGKGAARQRTAAEPEPPSTTENSGPKPPAANTAAPRSIAAAIKAAQASPNSSIQLEGRAAQILEDAGVEVTGFQTEFGPNRSVGEIDIETREAIIEVTESRRSKLRQVNQFVNDQRLNPNGKPVVLYAPNYQGRAGKDILDAGAFIARTPTELVNIIKSFRGK